MAVTLTYDPALGRVRLTATGLDPDELTANIWRTVNGVTWTTVRGGADRPMVGPDLDEIQIDDYEYPVGTSMTYRVWTGVDSQVASITVTDPRVWIKSLNRPFLNRVVTVDGPTRPPVTRPSRGRVLEVKGRTLGVGVVDVRSSQQWTMTVLAPSLAEAEAVEMTLAAGDILYVQVPPGCPVPGGYIVAGDCVTEPVSRLDPRYRVSWPCKAVAAPGPDVVGSTATWQTVLNTYPTWGAVMTAHPTWRDLMDLVGAPEDVIVP